MIEAVVFDMAGTTIDEQNVVYKTLRQAILEAGLDVSLSEVLKTGAGKEKRQAVADILQEYGSDRATDHQIDDIHSRFLEMLSEAYDSMEVKIFDGVDTAFDWLFEVGIKVVLNTGYARETAESLLHRLPGEVQEQIDLLVTASDVKNSRPAPDMIHQAMETLGINHPESVAKIGDSIIDIEEGKSADCGMTIGVTTGAHTREQLQSAQPSHVIDHMEELVDIIRLSAPVSD